MVICETSATEIYPGMQPKLSTTVFVRQSETKTFLDRLIISAFVAYDFVHFRNISRRQHVNLKKMFSRQFDPVLQIRLQRVTWNIKISF